MDKVKILEDYDAKVATLKSMATAVAALIKDLLIAENIEPHSISHRVKEKDSLANKIDKKEKYNGIFEVTDLVGVRIITHYADEVDKIAEIITKEFQVDQDNSVDKRATLDPDQFGYLSLHFVAELPKKRTELTEYKRFKDLKFEIQIRSILQHTWAEIEHDIGYKAKLEVPKPIRRKFSRLAGLLELADDQFIQIRDDLEKYATDVRLSIQSSPESIELDTISLFEYINTSDLVISLDREIAQLANFTLKPTDKKATSLLLKYIYYFGIERVSDLEKSLKENKLLVTKRAKDVNGKGKTIPKGVSIYYLSQALAATKLDEPEILNFLNRMNIHLYEDGQFFPTYLKNLAKT